jgi:putative chitinase
MITSAQLVQAKLAVQSAADAAAPALAEACDLFEISTGLRLAGFLAQCSHESCGFRVTTENLNYGAQALLATFPRYFDAGSAAAYAHQQERIANRVYGGRMGNGPEPSGDGWKFRGRGFIQLTGRNNYVALDAALGASGSLIAEPDQVALPKYAALSAAWFWKTHGLNEIADARDLSKMTKIINGGLIGIQERQKLYTQALAVFAV